MIRAINYQNNGHYNEYIILNKLWLKVFGFNEGYLLSVLHNWLLNKEKSGTDIYEGRAWVRCSYQQWEEYLPFKKSVLNTILTKLKGMNILLETDRLNYDKRDRTKWYSINYEMIMYYEKAYKQELNLVTVVVEKEKEQKTFSANHNFRKVDNTYSDFRNMYCPKNGDCISQNSDNAYSEIQKSEHASSLDIPAFNNTPNIKSNKLNNNSVCGGVYNNPSVNKKIQEDETQVIIKQVLENIGRALMMLNTILDDKNTNMTVNNEKENDADTFTVSNRKFVAKSQKQIQVEQILKNYSVNEDIIQNIFDIYDTEEKLQDLIDFFNDYYFVNYIANVPAFMKYVTDNRILLRKTNKGRKGNKIYERNEQEYRFTQKKGKGLREERDPSVYTSLEELYKKAIRTEAMKQETETISSLDELLKNVDD